MVSDAGFNSLKREMEELERKVANLLDRDYRQRILSNTFAFGDETDSDIIIQAYNADANKPGIKYNKTTNTWQRSNNGTTWANF